MAESAHLAHASPAYPIHALPTKFKSDWTWASLRTGAEDMQPFEYFKYRYYEKWLSDIAQFFVDAGYISAEESNWGARSTTLIPMPPCRTVLARRSQRRSARI